MIRTPHSCVSLQTNGFEDGSQTSKKRALPLGDYSIAGLEDVCTVERKDLSDLVHSCTADRAAFLKRLRLMARYPHRLLVITSTLSQIKSPYARAVPLLPSSFVLRLGFARRNCARKQNSRPATGQVLDVGPTECPGSDT
jgi:hypothetical protein